MEVMQFPLQYIMTIFDFVVLKRPKRFFQSLSDDASRYMNPYLFLATNVSLAGLICFAVSTMESSSKEGSPSRIESTLLFVGYAVVHCVTALILGKLAGFLLNEVTPTLCLLHAFCYTSVFYLGVAPLLALLLPWPESDLQRLRIILLAMSCVQILAVVYLLVSMAHSSSLHGRRLLAFVTVSGAGMGAVAFLALILFVSKLDDRFEYNFTLCETDTWPVAALTLPTMGHNPRAVVLMGASMGQRSNEWFEFGSTIELKQYVEATNGVGTARDLSANTMYYYRYVMKHGQSTCYGHVETFKTEGR